jgi:hypothetical protein
MTMVSSISRRAEGILLSAALGLLLACSPGETTYEIGGTVKFAGQPVSEGTVTFEETKTHDTAQAALGGDGGYSLRLPPGEYKVTVEPPLVVEQGVSDAGVTYKKVTNIPDRVRTSQSTPLKAKVDSAATLDFELKN